MQGHLKLRLQLSLSSFWKTEFEILKGKKVFLDLEWEPISTGVPRRVFIIMYEMSRKALYFATKLNLDQSTPSIFEF